MATGDPVEVYAAKDMIEAQFVSNLLGSDGVEATIVGEALGTAAGDLPLFTATPRIWVRPQDAQRARHVVQEYQKRLIDRATPEGRAHDSAQHAVPFCYYCGSEV